MCPIRVADTPPVCGIIQVAVSSTIDRRFLHISFLPGASFLKTFDIAVIEGDGIGPEVTREAIAAADAAAKLAQASFTWTKYPWGSEYYFEHGRMAPRNYLDTLVRHDAILLGAVG